MDKEIVDSLGKAAKATFSYLYSLILLILLEKRYDICKEMFPNDQWARVQVFSLSLIFKLWGKSHYRSPSFQQDMIDNLRNVAIPGTGIPLSTFCYSKAVCLLYVLFANPLICLLGAVNKAYNVERASNRTFKSILLSTCRHYVEHLLHPQDWFSLWRLNCRLASYQSHIAKSAGFEQENKWTFLVEGRNCGVPVSPFNTDITHLVCKNRNIEGGLGIHFFHNASSGGEWIIQERLLNASWLRELLPKDAPLSTMRVITSSTWSLDESEGHPIRPVFESEGQHFLNSDGDELEMKENTEHYIKALSSVLRLGRSGALTDHSSVLFDVETETGLIKEGTTNAHWYNLNLLSIHRCPWLPKGSWELHPDAPYPIVKGKYVPNMKEVVQICTRAHFRMMADVPLVGWDVAFTDKGIFLLEVNLSCNFFRGSFDMPWYIDMIDRYWKQLDKKEYS